MLYPVELRARGAILAHSPARFVACFSPDGRGRGIRTHDIQLPKLALYQAELYPGTGTFVARQRCERPDILGGRRTGVNDNGAFAVCMLDQTTLRGTFKMMRSGNPSP